MYTPIHNRESDRRKIVAFMREYPFATLITTRAEKISATHLPVLIDECDATLVLTAHLAKANTQWLDFANDAQSVPDALVIFQEPHAFISTRHYERPLSVPTWNYVAVHAYGMPRILPSLEQALAVVERTVAQFENTLDQWNTLPHEFRVTKANGIVAFEMQVTRLDARFKLSQDRTALEQTRIIETLTQSPVGVENAIGEMMRERRTIKSSS
jgi:transcriptional regulator